MEDRNSLYNIEQRSINKIDLLSHCCFLYFLVKRDRFCNEITNALNDLLLGVINIQNPSFWQPTSLCCHVLFSVRIFSITRINKQTSRTYHVCLNSIDLFFCSRATFQSSAKDQDFNFYFENIFMLKFSFENRDSFKQNNKSNLSDLPLHDDDFLLLCRWWRISTCYF